MARPFVFVALSLALAGCGGGSGTVGPAADDAQVSQQVIEYFQKTVPTPGLTFKAGKLEDAEIPGWRKGSLEVSLGAQSQTVAFYVSRDGHWMFRGDAVDLTVDPLRKVMRQLSPDGQPSRGAANAKVGIVEYSDFQCPFCQRAYESMEAVMKDYGDKARFVFKNFPLTSIHPWAEEAALASECALQQGGDQFWAAYTFMFSKQGELSKENVKDKVAEAGGGIDATKLRDCVEGKKAMDAVKADMAEATTLGVNSTPTFFVNGRRTSGAPSPEDFKKLIDQELGNKG